MTEGILYCHTHTCQAEEIESGRLAALKRVPIQDESELEDFMVEIDILAECKHHNIVQLYEAYYSDSTLWVCTTLSYDLSHDQSCSFV